MTSRGSNQLGGWARLHGPVISRCFHGIASLHSTDGTGVEHEPFRRRRSPSALWACVSRLRAGYILEGTELAFYIKKMAKKKSGKGKE